jgi:hypothetical protein
MIRALAISILLIAALVLDPINLRAQPEVVFEKYLSALKAGEWHIAESYWHPDQVRAARRLGIEYDGIRAKYDCASPMIGALDFIREGAIGVEIRDILNRGEWVELRVALTGAQDPVTVSYYLVQDGMGWRLASLPFLASRQWPVRETEYARVLCNDSTRLNREALRRLDRCIESIGRSLEIPPERMEWLADEKIDYYLCDDETMDRLVGSAAQGMTDLQFDALITRHLPHEHELAHLLFNYALKDLPLHTMPCVQEGVAVCLGGRWEKSPEAVFMLGRFALAEGFASVEEVLTFSGFHFESGAPDLSYAVSGLLCRFLIEGYGIKRFKRLYRALSGSSAAVREMSTVQIKAAVAENCGSAWEDIQRKFAEFWPQFQFTGLCPGLPEEARTDLCHLKSPNLAVTIQSSAANILFEIEAGVRDPNGVILVGDSTPPIESSYSSRLFTRHLPHAEYQGERYGIWFTDQEAGVYDYHTNILVAKYVRTFSPGMGYWDPDHQVIRFYLNKDLLQDKTEALQFRLVER